jgi:predicted TIM-barrel fold metal-dependent hydrolase
VAGELGHSVYVVCLGRPGTRTEDLVALATRHPTITFILGHGGFLGIDTYAVRLVQPHPTIMIETSGCFTATARDAVRSLGPSRVLFGSEYPLQHPAVELAKYTALDLPPAHWQQIAWHNAHRIFGEEPQ